MSLIRIDKYLVSQGICTRSEAKKYCKQGEVLVNGIVCRDSATKVDVEKDEVTWCNIVLTFVEHLYVMLNKPKGVISATEDEQQETVLQLLPEEWQRRGLFPVGRLDKDTEGLLLLTDDGKWAHRITAPKKTVFKTYITTVEGTIPEDIAERFLARITLGDGYCCQPGFARVIGEQTLEIKICEGKFHQVKRMCHAVGLEVTALERTAIGDIVLDAALPRGAYRLLCAKEVDIFA